MTKIEDRVKNGQDAVEEMPRVISKLSFLSIAAESCAVREGTSLDGDDLFGLSLLIEDAKDEFEVIRVALEKEEGGKINPDTTDAHQNPSKRARPTSKSFKVFAHRGATISPIAPHRANVGDF